MSSQTTCFICSVPLNYAPYPAPKFAKCEGCTAAEHESEQRDEAERECPLPETQS